MVSVTLSEGEWAPHCNYGLVLTKFGLCREVQQPITLGAWAQISAEALRCCLAVILHVSAPSSSVQDSVVGFTRLVKANE